MVHMVLVKNQLLAGSQPLVAGFLLGEEFITGLFQLNQVH